MDLHLLGFAVAVPEPSGRVLVRVRQAVKRAVAEGTTAAQAVVRTFDGPDAGLPVGQAACVLAPLYLDLVGRKRVGKGCAGAYLAHLARLGSDAARAVDPHVLVAVGWMREGEHQVQVLLAGPGGQRTLAVPTGTWKSAAGGQLSGVLQGELLVAMAQAEPSLLVPGFAHARQILLDRELPQSKAGVRGRL